MIVLAIGIGYFYVMPTFNSIGEMQDDIALYKSEREKIEGVNMQLIELVNRLEGVPASDQRKLLTYLPDQVDSIAVSRLLQRMGVASGLLVEAVSYEDVRLDYVDDAEQSEMADYPIPHEFSMTVLGSYQQIKNFLSVLETNEYPLEVHQLDISVVEGNFLEASLSVITYSHTEPSESVFMDI